MSLTQDGQLILCDGEECEATARLPVALRPELPLPGEQGMQTAAGWLFVGNREAWKHFCPRCACSYLRILSPPTLTER